MHELSIAESIMDIIDEELASSGGGRVTKVTLRVGAMSNVVPDALRFAFEIASQGRKTEGSVLDIEEVPARIFCHSCKKQFTINEPFLVCPACEGMAVELISGKELELLSLEIENES